MTYISSVGIGVPDYELQQDEVKQLIKEVFPLPATQLQRFLPVFDNTKIASRHFAVSKEWFKDDHTFEEKNDLYQQCSVKYSLCAIDDCLQNNVLLGNAVPYEAVDLLIFVSSTGLATPSIDTHLINARPFREDISRMPLWGLGCAGGAIGLSRAFDWLISHPEKCALVVCCELCSLTFQKNDVSKSNLVGTALFGDGAAASLPVGERSPYRPDNGTKPAIKKTSSLTKKESTSVMGWNITNSGLEVIFSKSIPALVNSFWKRHTQTFLDGIGETEIHTFISHPGGKKVLEAMESVFNEPSDKFRFSYEVLKEYGNMSSSTVLYVLRRWLEQRERNEETGILSALGPGISSELLLLEWKTE